jgi:hypothetical protein
MCGIDQTILNKATIELRKRACQLDPPEDSIIFEPVGGKETRIELLKLLNGRTKMWTQLFTTIVNNLTNNNKYY